MKAIYYGLLETKQRPAQLRPPEAGTAVTSSQDGRGVAPRGRSPKEDVSTDRPTKRVTLCVVVRCLEFGASLNYQARSSRCKDKALRPP